MKQAPTSKDVSADNPGGTMQRFTDGLRKVLESPKKPSKRKRKRRN